jgi:hypothetical protein
VYLTEYFLRRSALSHPNQVPITKDQLAELKCASCIQLEALYIEQKYDFVVENYLEFEETLLMRGINHLILGRRDHLSFHADTALFNRRIMNFLTAYKTYEDTYAQHLNRIFNRDRDVLRLAKSFFSLEFDSRVGYWIMPKIRNYVQHQGFPMHGSTYGSGWITDRDGIDRNRYTLDLYVYPQELCKGKFNLAALERLSRMKNKVDLKFLIRDFMEGFSAAHVKVRALVEARIEWAVDYTQSAREDFLLSTGYDSALALAATGPDDRFSVATIANDQRIHLVEKNYSLIRLSDRYISNEIENAEVESTR